MKNIDQSILDFLKEKGEITSQELTEKFPNSKREELLYAVWRLTAQSKTDFTEDWKLKIIQ